MSLRQQSPVKQSLCSASILLLDWLALSWSLLSGLHVFNLKLISLVDDLASPCSCTVGARAIHRDLFYQEGLF